MNKAQKHILDSLESDLIDAFKRRAFLVIKLETNHYPRTVKRINKEMDFLFDYIVEQKLLIKVYKISLGL